MLDVNIHKTNKVVLALKRKKRQRFVLMRKNVITRFCHVCVKPGSGTRVLDLGIPKLCRLSTIPTFNIIKVNRNDNRGIKSRTS